MTKSELKQYLADAFQRGQRAGRAETVRLLKEVAPLNGHLQDALDDDILKAEPASHRPPPKPPVPNFTGTITDSLGRKQYYLNGEHVRGPQSSPPKTIVDHPNQDHIYDHYGNRITGQELAHAKRSSAKAADLMHRVRDALHAAKLKEYLSAAVEKLADDPKARQTARDVAGSHDEIRKLLDSGDPDRHKKIAGIIQGHTLGELRLLRARLGLEAPKGKKLEVIAAIAARAAGMPEKQGEVHEVVRRLTVDEAEDRVRTMLENNEHRTPDGVKEIARMLQHQLRVADIHQLKKRLGLQATGTKKELADAIALRAGESQPRAEKVAAPEPAKPTPPPPPLPPKPKSAWEGVRSNATGPTAEDRQREENALDHLERMQQWLADKPDSLAAQDAVERAHARVASARAESDPVPSRYPPMDEWDDIASKEAFEAGLKRPPKVEEPDQLPGGRADSVPDTAIPAPAMAEGTQHEREHTSDPALAKEIAKDHLAEDPAYYDKLKQVEESNPASPKAEAEPAAPSEPPRPPFSEDDVMAHVLAFPGVTPDAVEKKFRSRRVHDVLKTLAAAGKLDRVNGKWFPASPKAATASAKPKFNPHMTPEDWGDETPDEPASVADVLHAAASSMRPAGKETPEEREARIRALEAKYAADDNLKWDDEDEVEGEPVKEAAPVEPAPAPEKPKEPWEYHPDEYRKMVSRMFVDMVNAGESGYKPGSVQLDSNGELRTYRGKKFGWMRPSSGEHEWVQVAHDLKMPHISDQKFDYQTKHPDGIAEAAREDAENEESRIAQDAAFDARIQKEQQAEDHPHTMTKKEFDSLERNWPKPIQINGKVRLTPAQAERYLKDNKSDDVDHMVMADYDHNGRKTNGWNIHERPSHRKHVKDALAAGKPVPPEVMADYPDLAPNAPKAIAAKAKPNAALAPILAEHASAPPRAKDAIESALYNSGVEDPANPPSTHDAKMLARRLASEHQQLAERGGMPDELAAVERAAIHAGLTKVHEPGQTMPFDPVIHASDEGISEGMPVTVKHAGWRHDSDGETPLVRPKVEKVKAKEPTKAKEPWEKNTVISVAGANFTYTRTGDDGTIYVKNDNGDEFDISPEEAAKAVVVSAPKTPAKSPNHHESRKNDYVDARLGEESIAARSSLSAVRQKLGGQLADMGVKLPVGISPEQYVRVHVSERARPDKRIAQLARELDNAEAYAQRTDKEKSEPKGVVGTKRFTHEQVHKKFVESALAAGKPVPPEVLADYPDLAAKHGKAASAAPEHAPVIDAINAAGGPDELTVNSIEQIRRDLYPQYGPKLTPGLVRDIAEKMRQSVDVSSKPQEWDDAPQAAPVHAPNTVQRDADEPAYTRRTPRKGTPERESHDAEWNSLSEASSELYDQITALEGQREASKYGSKKREGIDKKLNALREKRMPISRRLEEMKTARKMGLDEDMLDSPDKATRLAAMMNLKVGGYEGNKRLYQQITDMAKEEAKSQGFNGDAVDQVAMDAVSMLTSYPGSRNLKDQVEISGRVHRVKDLQRQTRDAISEMDIVPWQKKQFMDRADNHTDESSHALLLAEARKIHNANQKKKSDHDEWMMRGMKPEGSTNEDLLAHGDKTYDESTGSNRMPLTHDEMTAAFNRLKDSGRIELRKVGKKTLAFPVTSKDM